MGPTSSGKTQYLVNQLRGPFRGKLDHMVLIRPTFVHNRTYDGFKDNDSRMFAIDCPKEEVEEYKELMAELKTENFPIWSSPRATLLESKFYFELIYSQCLNRMLST